MSRPTFCGSVNLLCFHLSNDTQMEKPLAWILFFAIVATSYFHPHHLTSGKEARSHEHRRIKTTYTPTWDSLDSRPLPTWYDEAKFGIFCHWGLYSVPSFDSEWFWEHWRRRKWEKDIAFMAKNYPPGFTYADFAPQFRAEFFDPDAWAAVLNKSGARYFVFTSKHHEGWTNWRSNVSWNWNSVDSGPHRDLVGELAHAIRSSTNLTFGLYFSLYEWFNPIYLQDLHNSPRTQKYVNEVMLPQLYDIVNTYKPDVLWSDGDWDATPEFWKSKKFLAWLYNESPVKDTVVVNDRWGIGSMCKHGGFLTCADHYNPGKLLKRKWEDAMSIDKKSWGYRRNIEFTDIYNMEELTEILASTVSCGGNLLLNIGPTADGRIDGLFQERLHQMGEWLGVNGEAIYASKPWRVQNDTATPRVWYTLQEKSKHVYAIVLDWPSESTIQLGAPVTNQDTTVTMLGLDMKFSWKPVPGKSGIVITVPPIHQLPCKWAWVFRLENVK